MEPRRRKSVPTRNQRRRTLKAGLMMKMHRSDEAAVERTFRCCKCGMSSAGVPYSFGGQLACESCVRDNYPGASEDEIAEELRCRGNDAFRLIANEDKRRRKAVTPS